MINKEFGDRADSWLNVHDLIAQAAEENAAELDEHGAYQPTLLDEAEIAYQAFKIGVRHFDQDNHVEARRWLSTAVELGVAEATPMLQICWEALQRASARRDALDDESRTSGMDSTDIALLVLMQQDGRASFSALAKAVGVPEGAVRQRVQRLLREDIMQIVAVTDPANVGLRRQAMVGISVDGGDPHEVAERLSALPNVHYVAACGGRYEVLAELVCRDDEHLLEVLGDVRSIPGVSGTELFVYFRQAKHNFAWGKVTA